MAKPTLKGPLEQLVDDQPPRRSREMWQGIADARERLQARRHGSRDKRGFGIALSVCVGLLLGLVLHHTFASPVEGALARRDRSALPSRIEPDHAAEALDLSDGSRITVAQGARLDLLATSARGVSLALRHGRARFDVRPRGPRTWRIDCGAVAVEVVGTAFTIERSQEKLRVRVMRGAVLVRGAGVADGVQRLNAGRELEIRVGTEVSGEHARSTARRSGRIQASSAPPNPPSPPVRAAAPITPRRSVKAAAAEPAETDRALEVLWEAADAARARGATHEAVSPLEQLAAQEVDPARAALAAFTLAKLRLDRLDQPQQAVADLLLALERGLREPLAEEAHARLVEAQARAGEGLAACQSAVAYRTRYPAGSQAVRVMRFCPEPQAP